MLLFFPNLPIRLENEGRPHWYGGPTTKLLAWLFEQLRGGVERGKVVLGVETHAMRRALEGLIGMPVVYLPHPVPAKPGGEESSVESRATSKCKNVFTTTERLGGREKEQQKVGPKGEGVGTTESRLALPNQALWKSSLSNCLFLNHPSAPRIPQLLSCPQQATCHPLLRRRRSMLFYPLPVTRHSLHRRSRSFLAATGQRGGRKGVTSFKRRSN